MKEIECDVLVIGAGPAGSSAAWGVAREDLDVIIIEKKKTPIIFLFIFNISV